MSEKKITTCSMLHNDFTCLSPSRVRGIKFDAQSPFVSQEKKTKNKVATYGSQSRHTSLGCGSSTRSEWQRICRDGCLVGWRSERLLRPHPTKKCCIYYAGVPRCLTCVVREERRGGQSGNKFAVTAVWSGSAVQWTPDTVYQYTAMKTH